MRRGIFLILCIGQAVAQNESPPATDNPDLPPVLPQLEAPPLLNGKLRIRFVGNTAFAEAAIKEGIALQIKTAEDYGLDDAAAYDIAFFLDNFYRRHGYTQANTTPRIVGPWDLELTIHEGPVARVNDVRIHGNKAFSTEKIREYLLGPIHERYPRIRTDSDLPLVESDIFAGAELVRRWYASEGYLDAEIEPPDILIGQSAERGDIELTIEEGKPYRFGALRFQGETPISESRARAAIDSQTGGVFTPGRVEAARNAVKDLYVNDGYFLADVSVEADWNSARGGVVPVVFTISPGAVHHFQDVTVSGTKHLRDSFLKKRLRHLNGRRYDPSALNKTFRELMQTGLFRNLRMTPVATGGDEVEIQVTAEEAKAKEFGVSLGYASFYGGMAGITYRDLNLFGNGRPLRFTLEANQRGFSGEASYKDPWFLDTRTEFQIRLYALNSRLKGYSKDEVGFQPSLTWHLQDHWKLSTFLLGKSVRVNQVEIEPLSLVGPLNYSVFAIGISQTVDYRNNAMLPTSGFLFTTAMDFAPGGGGGISFIRGTAALSWYIPVTSNTSLALGARGGVVVPFGNSTLPIDERFFNGGATTVRSFSELTLGPKDHAGYPLGGEGYTVFNVEYNFPIYGDLHGAVFVDAGNVVSRAGDFGIRNMRYAVGAGLRYNLPIGALRLDYGLNPSPRDGEATGAVQIAVGVAF